MTPEEQAIRDKQEALAERAEREKKKPGAPKSPEVIFTPLSGGSYSLPPAATSQSLRRSLGCLGVVLTPSAAAVAGMFIGGAVGPQPDPNAFLDLTGLDWVIWGGVIGFFAGLLLVLLVSVLLRRQR